MSQHSHRGRPRLAAILFASAVLLPLGVVAPAQADAGGVRPASLGPGVNQGLPASQQRHAALRCAVPAKAVHFKESRAIVAVAVGMAESFCKPRAKGYDPPSKECPDGSVDRGLWQINSCYHSDVSNHCAYKPVCNARAAKRISDHGKDWTPWTTYNDGAYEQYLPVAKRAVKRAWAAVAAPRG